MATTRAFPLHENLLGGVDTTTPAHLLKPDQWRQQHNFRLTPALKQIPHKVTLPAQVGSTENVLWVGIVPGPTLGYGDAVALTPTRLYQKAGATWTYITTTPLVAGTDYCRWSTALYNGSLYFVNDYNSLRSYNSGAVTVVANNVKGRYLCFWYDHAVIGAPTGAPNQVMISDLFDFSKFTAEPTNEADHYDFVEWQQADYPYIGVTGLGKLRGVLYVYTPTAIIPVQYVGLPRIIHVAEEGIVTRTGNTYPWTLVCLDTVHFFYDAVESMFFVFDGQTAAPIGEPVRQYMKDNLNGDVTLAQKMYGYIDSDNREIWWPFVSKASTGNFDKAVVFNYRYKRWFTASVENVHCFCGGSRTTSAITTLTGQLTNLTGTISQLGLDPVGLNRVYGTNSGYLMREEQTNDADFVPGYDDPVLETPDFHLGDIRTTKEVDVMVLNTTAAEVEIRVSARDYLGSAPTYQVNELAKWVTNLPDSLVSFKAMAGRVFRYKFTFKNSRLVTFDAYSDGVLMKRAEK